METATHATPQTRARPDHARVTLISARKPVLEVLERDQVAARVPFTRVGPGRTEGESRWVAEPRLPPSARGAESGGALWRFRIDLGHGVYDTPLDAAHYTTGLREVWLQDKQLFAYEPPPYVSPARVEKIEAFRGRLPPRALYLYLPRGYDEQPHKHYPVIYFHDGQNVFEAFVHDSYAGSWRADETANRLIAAGQMREAIMVGVSNGKEQRMAEYLPPYTRYRLYPERRGGRVRSSTPVIEGRADVTAAYYQEDVAPFIAQTYRTLQGREHTATIGSSMGGLFSWYLAFEYPEFARHHAAMSSTFWITNDGRGRLRALTRALELPKRDIRLWLDSGEGKDQPGGNDDNKYCTLEARDTLLAAGYPEGEAFVYHLAEGARHHESEWAARLDAVLRFLMPPAQDRPHEAGRAIS